MPFVRAFEPRWIVLENVTGMQRWDGFEELIEELEKHYHLHTQVLNSANFGVPQTRKRLFVMGDRERMPEKVIGDVAHRHAAVILDGSSEWKSKPAFGGRLSENTLARVNRGIVELGERKDFLVVYYVHGPFRSLTA
jgi:DNA (cytosine-5)-methyltransferase 1